MPEGASIQDITLQVVLIAFLLLLNAFFAAAEISIVSLRRTRLRQLLEEERDPRAEVVSRLVEQPGRFLATVQVGVTLAGFFASAVGAVSLSVVAASWLASLPVPVLADNANAIAFIAVTIIIAYLSLVLGELAPKNIGILHAETIALAVARPIEILSKVARPLVELLTISTNFVMRLTGSSGRARVNPITEDEILAMVASGEEEGVVEPSARKLIGEVFEFGDTVAADVMVPRVDVRALSKEATLEDARQAVVDTGHTRLPVFDQSVDNIIGVIHAKDVLQHLAPRASEEVINRPVTVIMRPAYYVPESKRVSELLSELQRHRLHLAVVVDEYGGTAGIVTLDNLLEEIVGPIRDEYDAREEPDIQVEGPGRLVVSGAADLGDVSAALGADLEIEGVDTIGGMIYARLGRIPNEGDLLELPEVTVEVLSMKGRRVTKARVTCREPREPEGEIEGPF